MDKQMENVKWFFEEGCKKLNKLEQVEFLMNEGGYSEQGAFDLVYGPVEGEEFSDIEDYTPEDYYEE